MPLVSRYTRCLTLFKQFHHHHPSWINGNRVAELCTSCDWKYLKLTFTPGRTDLIKVHHPMSNRFQIPSFLLPHRGIKSISVTEELQSEKKIRKFLTDHQMVYETGNTCFITSCPRHVKKRIKLHEVDKLYINTKTGYFVCHSCKNCGPWSALEDNIAMLNQNMREKKRSPKCFVGQENIETPAVKTVRTLYEGSQTVEDTDTHTLEQIKESLNILEIRNETLTKYKVRVTGDQSGFLLPSFNFDGSLLGVRIITCQPQENADPNSPLKISSKTIPRAEYHGLFGWNTIDRKADSKRNSIVVTVSEFDALACFQETGMTSVALPKGNQNLPQQILPLLEQFSKIILWLGGDMHTWKTAKQFAKKLGDKRSALIRPDLQHPGPLAALKNCLDLKMILNSSKPMSHASIITFDKLRDELYLELQQAEQMAGVKWNRYPQLNKLLKGHRRGELTVFTGPTGSGKTTFISDYSLDLCMQGVNTLWGSFEIKNTKLLKTMISQFSGRNLAKELHNFNKYADAFEQLPMYFMRFHGQETIKKVIETMSHAVYVYDIHHVIVDNLQFMMGVGSYSNVDRFTRQDMIIDKFRQFATQSDCHVTLVIHPRKERAEDDLTLSSIFGGAKATQEADNVLILQDKRLTSVRGKKYIQVVKNRFDGELGVMLLKFNKNSLSYFNLPETKVKNHINPEDDDDGKFKENTEEAED